MTEGIREIEVSIELLKKKVRKAELLERLENNADFKEFIMEGFCKEHALGLIAKKASPSFQDEKNKFYMDGQLSAIGNLQLYMQFTRQEGEIAKQAIFDSEVEKERLIEEGAM